MGNGATVMRLKRKRRQRDPLAELKAKDQWVGFQLRGDKKRPISIRTGRPASVREPEGWCDYTTARQAGEDGRVDAIAYCLTKADGITLIDLDNCIDEEGNLSEEATAWVEDFNTLPEISISGRGLHLYLQGQVPAGRNFGNGIEIYSDARFCIITEDYLPGTPRTIRARQAKLTAFYREHSQESRNGAGEASGPVEALCHGERNSTLFADACSMRRRGFTREAILEALRLRNQQQCSPPLDEAEVERIAGSASRYDPAPSTSRPTDDGNADRFAQMHGDDVLHVQVWNAWVMWDGCRYTRDENNGIMRRARDTHRAMYDEAAAEADDERRAALAKNATRSGSVTRLKAMIELAKSMPEIARRAGDFDRHPMLLNLLNGTYDLERDELREHRREDLLTKVAPVVYDPKAKAPLWKRFLKQVLPDAGLRDFFQRAVGYSLTGLTVEHVLFILFGLGANGKTVAMETLKAMLGDYAKTASPEVLLAQRNPGPGNDVARLQGARFVCAAETDEGRRLAESQVKALVGGDTITARYLYGEFFEFQPQFKLFLSTNNRPQVRGVDHAIWRRIRLVPFEVTIPAAEQDRDLVAKLTTPKELSGILNWALEGLRAWKRDGLGSSDTVDRATAEYREEQDPLAGFLAERCVLGAKHEETSERLRDAYRVWCEGEGRQPLGPNRFAAALRAHGAETAWVKEKRGWRGVALRKSLKRLRKRGRRRV